MGNIFNLIKDVLLIFILIINMITVVCLSQDDGERVNGCNTTIMRNTTRFIKTLFMNKNMFGHALSVITLLISIPAILMMVLCQLVLWMIGGIYNLWQLGNKK